MAGTDTATQLARRVRLLPSGMPQNSCHRLCCRLIVEIHPIECLFAVERPETVYSGNAAGHFLRNWTNARRHHQATHGQGIRVY